MNIFFKTLRKNIIITIYLFLSITVALLTYKDYGISCDEVTQRGTGKVNLAYILGVNENLKSWVDRDYGTILEVPLVIAEEIFGWKKEGKDERLIYQNRHLYTHLFFILGGVLLFYLITSLFKSKVYGIIALSLYTINPRVYNHSFVNSKDIPFMVVFIICFYLFHLYLKKSKRIHLVLLAVCSGLLIGIRIAGVIFPLGVICYFIIFDFLDKGITSTKSIASKLLLFLPIVIISTVAFFPNLWSNPLDNFMEAFSNMSHFRHNPYEILFGETTRFTDDNSYFFKWFFIANPTLYVILFTLGLITIVYKLVSTKLKILLEDNPRQILFFCSFFVFSIGSILIKKSVIYSGWRQLFFLYPSIIITILFFIKFLEKIRFKRYLLSLFVIYQISIITEIIKLHPFQIVYFNEFISKEKNYRAKNFIYDYWGQSNFQALQTLLEKDKSKQIKVAFSGTRLQFQGITGYQNAKLFPLEEKHRVLRELDINKADYYITTIYKELALFQDKEIVFQEIRNNSPVITVIKLKE